MGIMRFMQASMYGKMHELAELRVKRWLLRHRARTEYQHQKQTLAMQLRGLEKAVQKKRGIVANIKENNARQREVRAKKLKIQKDLKSVSSGTYSLQRNNELKKLRGQNK